MKRRLLRIGLAVQLVWSMIPAGVSAQQPNALPGGMNPPATRTVQLVIHDMSGQTTTAPANVPVNYEQQNQQQGPTRGGGLRDQIVTVPVIMPPKHDPPAPRPIKDALNRIGSCCWNRQEHPGCTSVSAQINFMFGTCRQFFGEPCIGRAPGNEEGPNHMPGRGGSGGGGGGGCNCRQ